MKTSLAFALCLMITACNTRGLVGTPYSRMTCSQFTCAYTGHCTGNAQQLFNEGHSGTPKVGDIVAFGGRHVAVLTERGLLDSVPERGVGFVSSDELKDAWYAGPVRVVTIGAR
ncbi:MAG: hypothetical protein ACHQU0_03285 [Candidatus Paceibacteria bacterium]